ncbi:MAG: hypothetical protein LUG17_04415 [Clostridiales bacterium]|nr:hypothetical protein [Clostridiales bacterium]
MKPLMKRTWRKGWGAPSAVSARRRICYGSKSDKKISNKKDNGEKANTDQKNNR